MTRRTLYLVALSACAEPDYITSHGLEVYDDTGHVARADVEASTDLVLTLVGNDQHTLKGLELRISHDPVEAYGKTHAGLTYYGERFEVQAAPSCWARTAFAHELLHHFQWVQTGKQDHYHASPIWWALNGASESLEARANHLAVEALCPRDTE